MLASSASAHLRSGLASDRVGAIMTGRTPSSTPSERSATSELREHIPPLAVTLVHSPLLVVIPRPTCVALPHARPSPVLYLPLLLSFACGQCSMHQPCTSHPFEPSATSNAHSLAVAACIAAISAKSVFRLERPLRASPLSYGSATILLVQTPIKCAETANSSPSTTPAGSEPRSCARSLSARAAPLNIGLRQCRCSLSSGLPRQVEDLLANRKRFRIADLAAVLQ
jgi:hypothetical protein